MESWASQYPPAKPSDAPSSKSAAVGAPLTSGDDPGRLWVVDEYEVHFLTSSQQWERKEIERQADCVRYEGQGTGQVNGGSSRCAVTAQRHPHFV